MVMFNPLPLLTAFLLMGTFAAPATDSSSASAKFSTVRQSAVSPASLYNWTVVDRPDGSQHLVLTYRRDSLLLCVDLATGKTQQTKTEGFGYGLTTTSDGKVYIGTSMSPGARLFEYHLETNQLTELARVEGEEALFWIEAAPDGRIYGGSYPSTLLVRYDPALGELKNLGRLTPNQTHSSFGAVSPEGLVYAAVGMKSQGIIEYDPATGTMRDLWPRDWAAPDIARVYLGVDGNVYAYPGVPNDASAGKVLKISAGGKVEIAERPALQAMGAMPPTRTARPILKDGSVLEEVNSVKISIRSPSGELRTIELDASGGQKPIYSIGLGPGNTIFASSKPQIVFGYDADKATSIDLPRSLMPGEGQGGQIDSLGGTGSRLVMACYRHAKLYALDLAQDQLILEEFGPLGDNQDRPMSLLARSQDSFFIGTAPGYGHIGGAVSMFNPATGERRIDRNALPSQSVHCIAEADELLILGGSVHGGTGSGSAEIKQHALLGEYDPKTGKTLRTMIPVEGCLKISGLVTLPDVICGLTNEGVWFVVGRDTFELIERNDLKLGSTPWLTSLVYSEHTKRIYGIVGSSIIEAPADNPSEVVVAASIPGELPVGCGPVLGPDGNLYFGQDINLVRWTPTAD